MTGLQPAPDPVGTPWNGAPSGNRTRILISTGWRLGHWTMGAAKVCMMLLTVFVVSVLVLMVSCGLRERL